MILSQRYADFNNEQVTMSDYLSDGAGGASANAIRLGVTADQVTTFLENVSAYSTAYSAYLNPNTHNAITIATMRSAYDTSLNFVRPLRQQVKNGAATVTDDDYANLFIHKDKPTSTPSVRPDTAPALVFLGAVHLNQTYEAQIQSTEGVNRVALPQGVQIARELAVVATGTVPTEADYFPMDLVGRGRFNVMFVNAQVGMVAQLAMLLCIPTGRKGSTFRADCNAHCLTLMTVAGFLPCTRHRPFFQANRLLKVAYGGGIHQTVPPPFFSLFFSFILPPELISPPPCNNEYS